LCSIVVVKLDFLNIGIKMSDTFSTLEMNILLSKGLTTENIESIQNAGIKAKADFTTVGDAQTLSDVSGIELMVAENVMNWALGKSAAATTSATPANIVVDSPDIVKCVHCNEKQPRDYNSGDLCFSCGKQAEPVETCYWCGTTGPGSFCRSCGASHVSIMDFDIALLLKQEGVAKDEISTKIAGMDEATKKSHMSRAAAMRSR